MFGTESMLKVRNMNVVDLRLTSVEVMTFFILFVLNVFAIYLYFNAKDFACKRQ